MQVIKHTCPNCGASLEMNIDKLMAVCPYCRTELQIDFDVDKYIAEKEQTERLKEMNRSREYDKRMELNDLIIRAAIPFAGVILLLIVGAVLIHLI